MISNFHTHTHRCRHATGTEEEYIARALEGGFRTLGFSDHSPYWFDSDFYSDFRMFREQLPDYAATVLALKEKYAGTIEIRLGLETEYYPRLFPELLRHLRDYPFDYLLLGQHYVDHEVNQCYLGAMRTADPNFLETYCNQVIDAVYTGSFSCFAHPDIFGFTGDEKIYRKQMGRVCRAAKQCGIPLEINFLGLRTGRHYPDERLLAVAAEEGNKVIFGSDAHTAKDVWDPETEERALGLVKTYGLELVSDFQMRGIG